MTQTPDTGRNRRANRSAASAVSPVQNSKPADIAPKTKARTPQYRQPIGRSQELLDREQMMRDARRQTPTYSDFDLRDHSAKAAQPARTKKKRREKHTVLWLMVAFLCLMATGVLCLFAAPQWIGLELDGMPTYAFVNGSLVLRDENAVRQHAANRAALQTDRIFSGVYIDGVHVGGMTVQQAYDAVSATPGNAGSDFAITVSVGGSIWSIDSTVIPLYRNTQEVVMAAWSVGRGNTASIRGSSTTPFRQRLSAVQAVQINPRAYYTQTTYDRDAVRAMVDGIALAINRDPVNASVASFNPSTRKFTFNEDQSGIWIDADAIYHEVVSRLDGGVYQAQLTVEPAVRVADVTRAELMNSFGRISRFTTDTTSSSNRNTNIRLSCEAITNKTLLPGEIFSFNAATGQRTEAKGYKPAAAIAGGETFDEIGGGVCQTSSTLFNAAARANLEILDRDPHAWPSNYVEKGEDATVNWPNLDFKFRNNTEWPIFIVASYADRKCTVEIYGMTLGEGITIDLESETVYVKDPPSEPKYVQNPELPIGTEKVTVKARTGYTVETYKVWYRNGVEFKREKLHTSHYKMYQKTIEYN